MTGELVINVVGDICLTADNRTLVDRGDTSGLLNGVLGVLRQADLNIANLEAPVAHGGEKPLLKTGPNLANTSELLDVLADAGITVFGLANNHIKDFGSEGIRSTFAEINERRLRHVGAGLDSVTARQPLHLDVGGHRVGILTFADHEFSIATADDAGANGFDPLESLDDVRAARSGCDYLIVLFHGGIEHYEYPSPLLKRKLRKVVEAGADLVTAQHSHCIGAREEYRHGTIIYGQGNFLFGEKPGNARWNAGSVLQVTLRSGDAPDVRVIPVVALRGGGIDLDELQAAACLRDLARRGEEMQDDALVAAYWERFCQGQKKAYLPHLHGWNRYLTRLNKVMGNRLVDVVHSSRAQVATHNLIRCEAHHEGLETILEQAHKPQ